VNARIVSIGTGLPRGSMTQAQSCAFASELSEQAGARSIRLLYRRTGIERRGLCIADADGVQRMYERDPGSHGPTTAARLARFNDYACEMAIPACRKALLRAELDPGAITHLVVASCTGLESPGIDQRLIGALGLSESTQRTIIGFMGCHAAVNALRVAHALAVADQSACVLVCCVEVCSLHFSYSGLSDRDLANALFADGAASAVVRSVKESAAPQIRSFSARLWPDTADEMSWRIGNHGFEMGLSRRVPELLRAHTRAWIEPWLAGHGLGTRDVGSWAVHPGGPSIITAVQQSLALDDQKVELSRRILRDHGNMSSPTVLFILDALMHANARRPWVTLAFGPGLAGEAMLLA